MSDREKRHQRSAIALHYSGEGAPRVTAKGSDEVADAIVALAREHGIPLEQDPQLTRLLSRIDLGDEIPRELYLAVAEVLAFAYMVTGKLPPEREP